MAGLLTIHSNGSQLLDGHSWIEYKPDGGTATTYGTWGNNPGNLGNGLHENLEAGRIGEAHRSMRLSDEQEQKLFSKIQEYRNAGENGWDYLSPCSTFAADSWEAATGEVLAHRSGPISNPSKLKASIIAAEGKSSAETTAKPGSQRSIDSAVEPCSAGSTSSNKGSSGSGLALSGAGSTSAGSVSNGGSSTHGVGNSGSSGPSSGAAPPLSSR